MKQNFFPTLGAALDAVREYLVASKCVLAVESDLFDYFSFGGVAYGETKSRASLLSVFKGKPVTDRMAKRAVSVTVYRMESGTYECIAYVS
jgi:hypothetical protein